MKTYTFNDRQGNRDRQCHFAVIHDGKIYSEAEAEEKKLAVFRSLGYNKNGKWSSTTYEVTLNSASLVVAMQPFDYFSQNIEKVIEEIKSSCERYIGYTPTNEEALLFFKTKYPNKYKNIENKSDIESKLI